MENSDDNLLTTPLHGVQLVEPPLVSTSHLRSNLTDTAFSLPINVAYSGYKKPDNQPIWTLVDKGERYTSVIELYSTSNNHILNIECEGTGSFTIKPSSIDVNWQPDGTDYQHYIQSIGIACWLELNAIPCIHANAVSYGDDAYLIIAPSRTGKSTLTTNLLSEGFKMMTDDMAAIYPLPHQKFIIYPSWPKVRLWPDSAKNLLGTKLDNTNKQQNNTDISSNTIKTNNNTSTKKEPAQLTAIEYKKVHQKFAKYEINLNSNAEQFWNNKPTKLKAIYYLERLDNAEQLCQITQLSASHSIMMLLQNSILANAYTSMNIENQRLQKLAHIVTAIPVFNVSYKSGLAFLPQINKQLKKHINELS